MRLSKQFNWISGKRLAITILAYSRAGMDFGPRAGSLTTISLVSDLSQAINLSTDLRTSSVSSFLSTEASAEHFRIHSNKYLLFLLLVFFKNSLKISISFTSLPTMLTYTRMLLLASMAYYFFSNDVCEIFFRISSMCFVVSKILQELIIMSSKVS